MSKNPPLTEDQIRQSAEAEARHAATQAPRPPGLHDRAAEAAAGRRRARDDRRLRGGPLQGRSEQDQGLSSPRHRRARSSGPRGRRADQPARDQFALDRRPDRGWLDPVRRGARSATRSRLARSRPARRSIGDQIAAGSIPSGEALERLADFHEQHRRIVARTQSIKAVYERQLEIAKDPGAAVDDLRRRFPALNL